MTITRKNIEPIIFGCFLPASITGMLAHVLTHAGVCSHMNASKIDCFINNKKNNFIYNLLQLTKATEARIPGTHSRILSVRDPTFSIQLYLSRTKMSLVGYHFVIVISFTADQCNPIKWWSPLLCSDHNLIL